MHVHTYVHIEVCVCKTTQPKQQLVKVVNVYMYKHVCGFFLHFNKPESMVRKFDRNRLTMNYGAKDMTDHSSVCRYPRVQPSQCSVQQLFFLEWNQTMANINRNGTRTTQKHLTTFTILCNDVQLFNMYYRCLDNSQH